MNLQFCLESSPSYCKQKHKYNYNIQKIKVSFPKVTLHQNVKKIVVLKKNHVKGSIRSLLTAAPAIVTLFLIGVYLTCSLETYNDTGFVLFSMF